MWYNFNVDIGITIIMEVFMAREDIFKEIDEENMNVGKVDRYNINTDVNEVILAKKSLNKSLSKTSIPYKKISKTPEELISENKPLIKENNKLKKGKNYFLITCKVAALTIAVSILVGMGIGAIQKQNVIDEYTSYGEQISWDNLKRVSYSGKNYYDEVNIARALINEPETFDINLYGVYKNLLYDKFEIMERILKEYGYRVKGHEEELGLNYYSSFTDYCTKKGFVDEDGNVNLKLYEKELEKQISTQNKIDDLEEERKIFGSK